MLKYIVAFAGLKVAIHYDHEEVRTFLAFLFDDVQGQHAGDYEKILTISQVGGSENYQLAADKEKLFKGTLGVKFAAVLYDSVIFNLLNKNSNGVAIHAGAVAFQKKVILLPGESGSGKSTLSAWLTAHNYSYLTDELIFLPDNEPAHAIPFTRPFCIKSAGVSEIKKLIKQENIQDVMEDDQGAIMPHRSLNPDFSKTTSPPSLILFPGYLPASPLKIEKISAAKATTLLMTCHVNARNLTDHGFRQIVKIARSTPAYQVTYGCFQGFDEALNDLFNTMNWN